MTKHRRDAVRQLRRLARRLNTSGDELAADFLYNAAAALEGECFDELMKAERQRLGQTPTVNNEVV